MGNFLTWLSDVWGSFVDTITTLWRVVSTIPQYFATIVGLVADLPLVYTSVFVVVLVIAILMALKRVISL